MSQLTQKPLTNFNARRVHVTGMGIISGAGLTVSDFWNAAFNERTFISGGLGRVADSHFVDPKFKFRLMTQYALLQAMRDAGWESLTPEDGIILGTTTGEIRSWENDFMALANGKIPEAQFAESFWHEPLGRSLDAVCELLNFTGPRNIVASACSSSTQAVALGALWIKSGRVRRCLVGGAEVLCQLTIRGFQSLQLLSESVATPFDAARAGINLSEGAGFLCLEAEPNEKSFAVISGQGFSSDGYHMTSPQPEGRGCFEAMEQALASANISRDAVSWVHAHGTGSPANDLAEGMAIARLFGHDLPWVSSTKGIHGHALGASGVMETILCLEAMKRQTVLRTLGLKNPDPKIALRHPEKILSVPVRHILKNSLGFGGVNASLLISRSEMPA